MTSILLNADSYKASHFKQYPPDTQYVSSYIEPRGSKTLPKCVFFGLQVFLKEVLSKPITQSEINEAEAFFAQHGVPFNKEGWQYILDQHQGFLPLYVQALPEGSIVDMSTPVVQVSNSDPNCFWLTSYVETAILRAVWYPSTVASLAYACRQVIKTGMEVSCETLDKLPFMLNDFSFRGVSSQESAGLGGAAHLLSFQGTDNIAGILTAQKYYNTTEMLGFSIAASEHSTITSWGRDNESQAYSNMLTQFSKPGALVAVVSDSYDLFNAITNIWGTELKQQIIESGGTLVVRPDSGIPEEIVPKCLYLLADKFGYTMNSKGYRVLPSYVRLIQGDGINLHSLTTIINAIHAAGFSLDNVAFGMGGGLLQQVDRDTQQWAMKCSAVQVNNLWRDVYKDPITSSAKRSKKGVLAVVKEGGVFKSIKKDDLTNDVQHNWLEPVFIDGHLLVEDDFSTIKNRLHP